MIIRATTAKGTYDAKTVILAVGARKRMLGLSREEELIGAGVSYCATCDGMFYQGKFNQDISNWKIRPDCNIAYMFFECPIKEEYKPKSLQS